jgi:uncharacterized membrane protein YoaK (UPF0700 family)
MAESTDTHTGLLPRQSSLVFLLGAIAGFVDGVTFLTLFGLFTANMSGNAARLGVTAGEGNWSAALTRFVPIVVWIVVVVATVIFVETRGRGQDRELRPLLLVEAGLLGVFVVLGTVLQDRGDIVPQSLTFYGLAVIAAFAMGVQTSALRRAGGVGVHTTFISGMVVNLAEDVAAAWRRDDPMAGARARMHGIVVVTLISGAALGALLLGELELWCVAVPIVTLLACAASPAATSQP